MTATECPFASLRRDIGRALCALGLSQDEANWTLPSDSYEGEHDAESDQEQERELLDGDADERGASSMSGLRPEGCDEPGGRRVLPLDSVPVVRLAQPADGDVERVLPEHLRYCAADVFQDLRGLLIEADSAISHMHYRGVWPLDRFETDRLIGRLREASRG